MRNRLLGSAVVVVILAVLLNLTGCRAETDQSGNAVSTPDISGVWMQRTLGDAFTEDVPPMQPWALERTKANAGAGGKDPEVDCLPSGMPRIYLHRYPVEILQLPGRVIMLFEYDHIVRQIWTDGRAHPSDEELDQTWMGHSIGRWDGDTLVVDSVGFNDTTWLDNLGHPHSDALHVVERVRRVDQDTLQIDFMLDDPNAYTEPWTGQKVFRLRPSWEITEHVCNDGFLWKEPGQ